MSVKLLNDGGIGWHIRAGQIILASHSVPHVDPFSSTMQGQPWFAWEWLYDVIVGRLEHAASLNGVVWFNALMIAATFAAAFRVLIRRGTRLLVGIGLLLLSASAAMVHFLARPHVVSWLFVVVWFWILDGAEASDSAFGPRRQDSLWLLPPLMLVWVNLHGGFLIGFVLLAIYLVEVTWQWFSNPADDLSGSLRRISAVRRARSLVAIAIVSGIATLVNPYGWKLHLHIYRYLTDRFLMDHIEEFQSPNFHGVAQKCFAVLLLLTLIAFAMRRSRLRVSDVLIALFAVYAGIDAARNIPVSALLLAFVIGPLLTGVAGGRPKQPIGDSATEPGLFARMLAIERKSAWGLWSAFAAAIALGVALNGGKVGGRVWMDAHFDARRFPMEAVDYLQKAHVAGPVLGPDYWGGYFIYRLYPSALVALDDRHDLYGADELKSYLRFLHAEAGWEEFVDQAHSSCLVLPVNSAMANVVDLSGKWNAIYRDQSTVVFVPKELKRRER